jgi:hypothetical protein
MALSRAQFTNVSVVTFGVKGSGLQQTAYVHTVLNGTGSLFSASPGKQISVA